jgi:hypothetical protein
MMMECWRLGGLVCVHPEEPQTQRNLAELSRQFFSENLVQ